MSKFNFHPLPSRLPHYVWCSSLRSPCSLSLQEAAGSGSVFQGRSTAGLRTSPDGPAGAFSRAWLIFGQLLLRRGKREIQCGFFRGKRIHGKKLQPNSGRLRWIFPWEPVAKCSVSASTSSQGFNPAGVFPPILDPPPPQNTEWESQIPGTRSSADPGAQPSPLSLPSLLLFSTEGEGDGAESQLCGSLVPRAGDTSVILRFSQQSVNVWGSPWCLCHTGTWEGVHTCLHPSPPL